MGAVRSGSDPSEPESARGSAADHERFRRIPKVDQLLRLAPVEQWIERTSRGFVVSELQALLGDIRERIRGGEEGWRESVEPERVAMLLETRLARRLRPALRPVINATGVVLHTNLGRAPLSEAAQRALTALAGVYTNLEYDLETGERSHRDALLEGTLRELLGCEAATVVNNNAAAVFLILETLAAGREVVVSRGELIEIGGSFRIPDILARSGAALREVGTTNKTRAADYEAALGPSTALILRVHPSNYRIRGFTERPELEELVALSRRAGIPLVEDIGSGCLVDLGPYGIPGEPVARRSLEAGADLICFSGDKLLGGPQAGIIAGRAALIASIRRNPLMRTYRVEKLVYGALEATLGSYRSGRAMAEIPILRAITITAEEVRVRSRRFAARLKRRLPRGGIIELLDGVSVVGGGSCPDVELPTTLLALESENRGAGEIEAALRAQTTPIIVRLDQNRVMLDLRTVFPNQESILSAGISSALVQGT
jgi:L-seryl-tRNA(Ser) seleniumtransferase